jgi:tetratricopeptide (TPR) repeat protein
VQGLVYEQNGSLEKAAANFQMAVEVSNGNPIYKAALSHAFALSGNNIGATHLLEELKSLSHQQFVSPYNLAVIHAGLGQPDEVYHWLQKAVEIMSVWIIHLHFTTDPRFNAFKNDHRYGEILRKVGLQLHE